MERREGIQEGVSRSYVSNSQTQLQLILLFPVAIQALQQTVVHLTKLGRFRQAADREKEIGQLHLQEFNNLGKAVESFRMAADWYQQEDSNA